MSEAEIRREVKAIGADSWALFHFEELPPDATRSQMHEALGLDARWITDHCDSVVRRIEVLQDRVLEAAR